MSDPTTEDAPPTPMDPNTELPVDPAEQPDPSVEVEAAEAEVEVDPHAALEVEVEVAEDAEDAASPAPASAPAADDIPDRSFRAEEQILLIDRKKRRYLVTLEAGGEFHTHAGFVPHDDIIGSPEGALLRSTRGATFTAFRPTLSDFVLKMPRGAQVIYPKDLGPILMLADIFPGARVLESGVGSGALSMTLLRAGAHVTGYEIRGDFASRAVKNVKAYGGEGLTEHYRVEERDIYEGIDVRHMDRIVLDLPEPWQVVPHAEEALRPGGILVAYTPAITQAVQLRERLVHSGFELAETMEVLHRGWNIDGMSVRPDHRMVAHTGFLTHARLLPTPD